MTRRRWGVVLLLSIAVFVGAVITGGTFERPAPVYEFNQVQARNPAQPVTWDPCAEIVYRVNTAQAPGTPAEADAFVDEAIAHVADLTGLTFRRETGRRNDAPVLIAWQTEDQVDALAGTVAGATYAGAKTSGGRSWYRFGSIFLDVDAFDETGLGREGRSILLHELGHLVGLDHVDSRAELMYPSTTHRVDYGRGDREGLARLGKGAGP